VKRIWTCQLAAVITLCTGVPGFAQNHPKLDADSDSTLTMRAAQKEGVRVLVVLNRPRAVRPQRFAVLREYSLRRPGLEIHSAREGYSGACFDNDRRRVWFRGNVSGQGHRAPVSPGLSVCLQPGQGQC